MRCDATVTKREHMVAIYKEKESYKKLREFQDKTSEPGLATPRCDVPKHEKMCALLHSLLIHVFNHWGL